MTKVTKATADLPAIVREYAEGDPKAAAKLAEKHGVSRQTIYNWIFSELGDQYPQVVTQALIRRIADADDKLDQAADALALARAREQARFARMDLERRRPALYGQKQEITHQVAPILNISVADTPQIEPKTSDSGTVIDNDTQQVHDK